MLAREAACYAKHFPSRVFLLWTLLIYSSGFECEFVLITSLVQMQLPLPLSPHFFVMKKSEDLSRRVKVRPSLRFFLCTLCSLRHSYSVQDDISMKSLHAEQIDVPTSLRQ